jgi:stage II sporulation protein P
MEYFLNFVRAIFFIPLAIILLFVISSAISYSNTNLLNGELDTKVAKASVLIKLMSYENTSIRLAIMEEKVDYFAYGSNLLEKITSIKIEDMKSYLQNEIPGHVIVENTQTSAYVPMESSPPLEVLLYERELSERVLEQMMEINPSNTGLVTDLIGEMTNNRVQ